MTRYLGFGLLLATVGLAQDVSRMDEVVQYNVSNKKFMGSVLVVAPNQVSNSLRVLQQFGPDENGEA